VLFESATLCCAVLSAESRSIVCERESEQRGRDVGRPAIVSTAAFNIQPTSVADWPFHTRSKSCSLALNPSVTRPSYMHTDRCHHFVMMASKRLEWTL
jgi:hypothetical protein